MSFLPPDRGDSGLGERVQDPGWASDCEAESLVAAFILPCQDGGSHRACEPLTRLLGRAVGGTSCSKRVGNSLLSLRVAGKLEGIGGGKPHAYMLTRPGPSNHSLIPTSVTEWDLNLGNLHCGLQNPDSREEEAGCWLHRGERTGLHWGTTAQANHPKTSLTEAAPP